MLATDKEIKIGARFGYLTVTSESFSRGSGKLRTVICDCGQKNEVSEYNLLSTISCGCAVGEKYRPIKSLPESQREMRSKFLSNGKLLIVEDQTVYRVKGKLLYRCSVSKTSRDYRYHQVSYSENGKQRHVTVHRLMAEAFIPNPENKPQINHKDGNPRNNSLDNLEWVTAQENVAHAYEMGLTRTLDNTPYNCIKCTGAVMNPGSVCTECKLEMRGLKGMLLSKQNQRNKFRNIDTTTLKSRYRNIIKSRFRGDTLQEIGDRMGVSREYVRQLEERVLNKDPRVYKVIKKANKPKSILITIKAARVNADKGVNEIAESIGITTTTLHNWERYKSKIPYPNFTKLCKLYNMPPENISGYRDGNWFVATHRKEQPPCNN